MAATDTFALQHCIGITLDYMDIGPYILPERSTVNVEISPLLGGFRWKFRRIITQGRILCLKRLGVIAERHTGCPWSLHARSFRAVLQFPRAPTRRVLAAVKGPFDLLGERVWRQYRIGEPSQTLTSVRLTDSDGAAGLPDRD
jgi:hypothetical protein